MNTLRLFKKYIMKFIELLYLDEEEQTDIELESDMSVIYILKTMGEIALGCAVSYLIFLLPIF